MTNDPCRNCCDYPRECMKMCSVKKQYINEVDESTPLIKRQPWKKKRVFSNGFNKNGIRRVSI